MKSKNKKLRNTLLILNTLVLTGSAIALTVNAYQRSIELYGKFQKVWSRNDHRDGWEFSLEVQESEPEMIPKVLNDNLKVISINDIGETSVLSTFTRLYKAQSENFGETYFIDTLLACSLLGMDTSVEYPDIFKDNIKEFIDYNGESAGTYIPVGLLESIKQEVLGFNEETLQIEAKEVPFLLESIAPVGEPALQPYDTPAHKALQLLKETLLNHTDDWTLDIKVSDGEDTYSYIVSRKDGSINWGKDGDTVRVFDGGGNRHFVFEVTKEVLILPINKSPELDFPKELRELLEFDFNYHLLVEYGSGDLVGYKQFYERHVVLGKRDIQFFMDDNGLLQGFIESLRGGVTRAVTLERRHGASAYLFSPVIIEGEAEIGDENSTRIDENIESDNIDIETYRKSDMTLSELVEILVGLGLVEESRTTEANKDRYK
jgi:hypothetical protein